ncbi:hypothetical protein HPULCUR_010366 [Helicostylum pulchrum]|uniref:Uncharacterized protein n=1 Tax=Helicostylum pulchrum TaxID=562976 RepID=A0ABP9YD28_9FUNG
MYFKEKPLSNWEEEDFVCFYGSKDVSKTKRKGLQASFLYCLNCIILRDQDVPDDIKEFVKMKRKDIRGLIKNYFSTEDLKMMHKATKYEVTSDKISFDQNLYFSIKEAIEKFEEDEEELDFSINLLAFCKTSNQHEARVIKAIVYLFPELISVKNCTLSEAHLSASFVHPVIRSLFSSPNVISHCSNIHQTDSNRPDYKVNKYAHYQYSCTPVFGEFKTYAYSSNTKLLITDLYHLAIFMKNEIVEKNLRLTIGFQVVGKCWAYNYQKSFVYLQ